MSNKLIIPKIESFEIIRQSYKETMVKIFYLHDNKKWFVVVKINARYRFKYANRIMKNCADIFVLRKSGIINWTHRPTYRSTYKCYKLSRFCFHFPGVKYVKQSRKN